VTAWPAPKNVKELRSFFGLPRYYRKFVRNIGVISRPLSNLLKKNIVYVWTQEHESAFAALKQALVSTHVLALPNFEQQFIIETDASDGGMGVVLMQGGHPLTFLSKVLGVKSRGLSTYEKEYMTIPVQHWRAYLQQDEFLIHTDHKSLAQLNEQRLHTPWQHKVFTKLLGLQYKVVYKKGADNRAVDALSRRVDDNVQLSYISATRPQWLSSVQSSYESDPVTQKMLTKLFVDSGAIPKFTLKNGVLGYKSRIWIGNVPSFHTQLISVLHESALGSHSRAPITYRRLKQHFAWKGMRQDVQKFVADCQV
jgi:hypothetical protein